MSHLPDNQGTVEDILQNMIELLGKEKVCEQTHHVILSFNDQRNKLAMKNIKSKIQKVISKHKDTIFKVYPIQYTFKPLDRVDSSIQKIWSW